MVLVLPVARIITHQGQRRYPAVLGSSAQYELYLNHLIAWANMEWNKAPFYKRGCRMKYSYSDLNIRLYEPTDTRHIITMINKDPYHFLNGMSETRFEQDLDEPGERIRENMFVVEINDISVYLSLCFVESNTHISVYCYGTVDTDWRRQGVGTSMFKFIFSRLNEMARCERKPIQFVHRAVTRIPGETTLGVTFGMEEQNTLEVMSLNSLNDIKSSILPSGVKFRTPTLDAEVRADIYNDAFDAHRTPESVLHEFQGIDFSPDFYVLCIDDMERPVGFVTSLKRGLNGRIPTIAVKRQAPGGGIGKALLAEALHRLKYSGATDVRLTVDSKTEVAKAMYLKFGFEEQYKRVHYVKTFPL